MLSPYLTTVKRTRHARRSLVPSAQPHGSPPHPRGGRAWPSCHDVLPPRAMPLSRGATTVAAHSFGQGWKSWKHIAGDRDNIYASDLRVVQYGQAQRHQHDCLTASVTRDAKAAGARSPAASRSRSSRQTRGIERGHAVAGAAAPMEGASESLHDYGANEAAAASSRGLRTFPVWAVAALVEESPEVRWADAASYSGAPQHPTRSSDEASPPFLAPQTHSAPQPTSAMNRRHTRHVHSTRSRAPLLPLHAPLPPVASWLL